MTTRRDFLKKAFLGTTVLSLGNTFTNLNAKSYSHIIGSNDKIKIAAIGVHSRGAALATNFVKQKGCIITYVCDVERRRLSQNNFETASSSFPNL